MDSLFIAFVVSLLCQQAHLTFADKPRPNNVCYLPEDVGPCDGAIPRWYFRGNSKRCEQFTYGGCQGNKNNFLTLKECQKNCPVCSLPQDTGPCKGSFPRYYFNGRSCRSFIYGGCQGNANNFNTLKECEDRCLMGKGRSTKR